MDPLRVRSRRAFDRWQRFAESPAAVALLFCWAFAEATLWPILADFLLVPLALACRRGLRRLLVAVLAGMALGGVVTVLVANADPSLAREVVGAAPLVGDRQFARAGEALDEHGVAGFLRQPYSGVPFKAWAVAAGERELAPALVIPAFVAARAIRMVAVGLAAAGVGRLGRARIRDWFLPVAAGYVVLFALGLAATVAA